MNIEKVVLRNEWRGIRSLHVSLRQFVYTFTPRPIWLTWATMCTYRVQTFNFFKTRIISIILSAFEYWTQDGWLGKTFLLLFIFSLFTQIFIASKDRFHNHVPQNSHFSLLSRMEESYLLKRVYIYGFNVALDNLSGISQSCLVVTGGSVVTFYGNCFMRSTFFNCQKSFFVWKKCS